MLISRSVQTKIVALAGACLLATAGAIVGYAALSVRSTAIDTATAQARSDTAGVADKIAGLINTRMMLAKSLSMTLSGVHREDVELDISRQAVMGILQTLLASDEGVRAIYTAWEPDAFDALDAAYEGVEGADAAGRFVPYVHRDEQGQISTGSVSLLLDASESPDGSPLNAFYEIPKATKQPVALGPRPSAAPDLSPADVIVVVAPIVIEDAFFGVVGVEMDVEQLARAVGAVEGVSELALLGHAGRVVAASQQGAASGDPLQWPGVQEAWRSQQLRLWDADGQLYCYTPVPLQASTSRWGLVSRMPRSSVTAQASTLMWRLVGISGLLLAAALLAMFFVAKSVARPIQRAASMLREIADGQGDLTARLDVRTNDEIGVMADAYNTFVHSLCQLIGEVANVTDRVDSVSDAAAQTSRLTVEKIDEQRRRVEQIASAVEQLAHSIDSAASIAENTAKTAAAAGETAVEGSEVVANAIQCMETIRDEIAKTKEVVGALGSRSEQIGEVIRVVNDIADQINLLALNAAIEAARAGEHGRGFAVVADEVRKLAESTTEATGKISEVIKGIQDYTMEAVSSMEASSTRVDQGVELSESAGKSLRTIVENNQSVAMMIDDMVSRSKEQAASSRDAASNVEAIRDLSNQVADQVQEANTGVAQLAAESSQLRSLVSKFKIE